MELSQAVIDLIASHAYGPSIMLTGDINSESAEVISKELEKAFKKNKSIKDITLDGISTSVAEVLMPALRAADIRWLIVSNVSNEVAQIIEKGFHHLGIIGLGLVNVSDTVVKILLSDFLQTTLLQLTVDNLSEKVAEVVGGFLSNSSVRFLGLRNQDSKSTAKIAQTLPYSKVDRLGFMEMQKRSIAVAMCFTLQSTVTDFSLRLLSKEEISTFFSKMPEDTKSVSIANMPEGLLEHTYKLLKKRNLAPEIICKRGISNLWQARFRGLRFASESDFDCFSDPQRARKRLRIRKAQEDVELLSDYSEKDLSSSPDSDSRLDYLIAAALGSDKDSGSSMSPEIGVEHHDASPLTP